MNIGKVNNTAEVGQGRRVVVQLTGPYVNSGRRVFFDNFFTSIPLCEELVAKNLPSIGTVRKNKREIPVAIQSALQDTERKIGSCLQVFNGELMMTSWIAKKGKHVVMLSSEQSVVPAESYAQADHSLDGSSESQQV